jgi:hypothetical protein
MVESVMIYGAEGWNVRRKDGNKQLATETDYLRRRCRRTRLDRIQNETTREMVAMERDIIDETQKRQLISFGHTDRMDETRSPRKLLKGTTGESKRRVWRDDVKEETSLKKIVIEEKSGDLGWKHGGSCKLIICKYISLTYVSVCLKRMCQYFIPKIVIEFSLLCSSLNITMPLCCSTFYSSCIALCKR